MRAKPRTSPGALWPYRIYSLWFFAFLTWAACVTAPLAAQDLDEGEQPPVVQVQTEFTVGAGGTDGELSVTAEVREQYHIYAMTQPKPFLATEIHVDRSRRFEVAGEFRPSQPPTVERHDSIDVELHVYQGRITWTAPLKFAPGVDPRSISIIGYVKAQACSDAGCLMPEKYPFTAHLKPAKPGTSSRPQAAPPERGARPEGQARRKTAQPTPIALDFARLETQGHPATGLPLLIILPMAFAAGVILNFMPCVLPVLGLKIMSFAEQAGHNRRRVFLLNVWYTLGILVVFMILASLAAFLGLGWGQQFSSVAFNVVLASVVFVFALSFLGVWEIPIPGFVGAGRASQLAHREGALGAFSKGVLTTVLATPCSGPLLGSVLTWAVAQPPLLTYLVFTTVGLGMASPYLLVGAFPTLIAYLVKPGARMNTFKQAMGFVLLATVVYLLTFMQMPYVVPTMALFVGLGAGCWWVGRVPPTVPFEKTVDTWLQSAALCAAVGFVSFGWLHGVMNDRFQYAVDRELAVRTAPSASTSAAAKSKGGELEWQPYSHALLARYTAAGRTVLVDFTADWCLTCKANEAAALNQAATRRALRDNGVVTLKADKTQPAPEADELLARLGNKAGSIPFYAVFPARNPNQPITLDGLFTSPEPILQALRQAGPSQRRR